MKVSRRGIDLRIGLDMVGHARNSAAEVMFLVSGDDDLSEAVEEAQAQGVQVMILGVPTKTGEPHGVNKHLQRASDGLELLDGGLVDDAVKPTAASIPAVIASAPAPSVSSGPSPAAIHSATSRAAMPKPTGATSLVYSSSTGGATTISSEYERTSEEHDGILTAVAQRVAQAWLPTVDPGDGTALVAGRRSIPREIDRTLLQDASGALGIYDLNDRIRYQLRDRFWDAVERATT